MNALETMIGGVIARTHAYMEETGRTDSFERFPYLSVLAERLPKRDGRAGGSQAAEPQEMPEAGAEAVLQMASQRQIRLQTAEDAAGTGTADAARTAGRYEQLLSRLSGDRRDPVLKTALELALTASLVTEFAAYLNYYTGNRATLQLASEMCGVFCSDYRRTAERLKALSRVLYVEKKEPLIYANLEAGHALLFYLTGDEPPENGSGQGGEFFFSERIAHFSWNAALHPMYAGGALAGQGAELLARGKAVLHICGRGGRRFLVKHIAKRMKKDVLFVQARQIGGEEKDDWDRLWMQVVHEAFLYARIVCIDAGERGRTEDEKSAEETAERLFCAVQSLSEAGIPVIVCTENADDIPVSFLEKQESFCRIRLTPLSRTEREAVWRGLLGQKEWNEEVEQCSARYHMNAKEIARAVAEWSVFPDLEEQTCKPRQKKTESLPEICCRILCGNREKLFGALIMPRVGLSDLIVSGRVKRLLKEIRCGALRGYRLYEEWGLEKKYPYGKNLSVLLAGPPGTGKTMTAHALAHEIGAPLYQVDLSHIMDKYIGETEKHLEQVFTFAEKTGAILFFDEADALFAKRGEVTEGKDRYANMEVSFLLQRMEQFNGVVILATNFYQHIDRAFLRRIKYVLKYREPDAAMRKKLWESCLVKELPQERLDTDYLAKQFAFSGGIIKNVIQSACISAVYEERPLCMEHVLSAVRMEYEKLERNITPELWGEYGYLAEERSYEDAG